MKRRHLIKIATFLTLGSIVTQAAGPCWIITANTLIAGAAGALLDANGRFLGVINVCGIPDVVVVDTNGVAGDVQNDEDDLFTGCPITFVQEE